MKKAFFFIVLFSVLTLKAEEYILKSPNAKYQIVVDVNDQISYSFRMGNKVLIENSFISMEFLNGEVWGKAEKIVNSKLISKDTVLIPLFGIKSELKDCYNDLILEFKKHFYLAFRLYDNGFAYRFVGDEAVSASVKNEQVNFGFKNDAQVYYAEAKDFQQAFEGDYKKYSLSELKGKSFSLSPVLVKTEKMVFLISEADLQDYPGMFLKASDDKKFQLEGVFAPYVLKQDIQTLGKISPVKMPYFAKMKAKKRAAYIAKVFKKRSFPWRVVMFEENEMDLLKNTLVYQLGPVAGETDWSWVKPGKVVWDWYHYWSIPGVDFKSGLNTETYLYYIDFAAKHGFEYVNLDFGWSPLWNLSKSIKKIDLPKVIEYANSKGVGVFLWMVWYELDKDMKNYLDLFERWGVKGLKVDFMDRDDQQIVQFYKRLSEETATRKLLINLHGAYKPTGLSRKYPNFITREGVLGLEYNKFGKEATSEHNVELPFIRNVVGAMDYTPGAMRYVSPKEYKKNWKAPAAMTTRVHQLAMYVVYYSPLQMIADAPTLYSPESLDFLSQVPVTWDEVVPLEGEIGAYVVLARRKGKVWYIAGMNSNGIRNVSLDFRFLSDKLHTGSLYLDGEQAEDVVVKNIKALPNEVRQLEMKPDGGFVLVLKPE